LSLPPLVAGADLLPILPPDSTCSTSRSATEDATKIRPICWNLVNVGVSMSSSANLQGLLQDALSACIFCATQCVVTNYSLASWLVGQK
jgi:hypothetical protein